MRAYVLTHLSDAQLLRDLKALVNQERTTSAAVLAHIAEVDARKLRRSEDAAIEVPDRLEPIEPSPPTSPEQLSPGTVQSVAGQPSPAHVTDLVHRGQ